MTPMDDPCTALPSCSALSFDALHIPATRRSAERAWYDVITLTSNRFVVSVGNVAGSEADAAALRLTIRKTFDPSLATVPGTLSLAADALLRCQRASSATLATTIVGIVDCTKRTFRYLSAGHPPPFLRYHAGTVAALPADDLSIGLAERDHPPGEIVVDLHDAELLVLYSSVLVQSTENVDNGLRRLHHVLVDDRMAQCDRPASWIARRMLDQGSHDDVALLALMFPRARPALHTTDAAAVEQPRWSVRWSFDATGASSRGARRAFMACLDSKAPSGRSLDIGAAELIFGELLGNVVRHAPGPVEITLDWTSDLPVLHVRDSGPGFHSRRARERLPLDALSEGGRGLFIVAACATTFRVRHRKGRGTCASATLPLT